MIKKKVIMLGSFAVGKTSLVQRYVNSIFSEKYQTTIGVKIDQKKVDVDGEDVNLLIWDIHGEDDYQKINPTYLVGTSGCFLVIDGTRKASMEVGIELISLATKIAPLAKIIILINKFDLKEEWDITDGDIEHLKEMGYEVFLTSAKENHSVDDAFSNLAIKMLNS